jgi:hypothetical protein
VTMRYSDRKGTHEGEVSGSNSSDATAEWLTGGVPPQIQKKLLFFVIFLGLFLKKRFVGTVQYLAAPINYICKGGWPAAPINQRFIATFP